MTGMEPITVPGAFDGWVTLLEKLRHDEAGRPAGAGDRTTRRTASR